MNNKGINQICVDNLDHQLAGFISTLTKKVLLKLFFSFNIILKQTPNFKRYNFYNWWDK